MADLQELLEGLRQQAGTASDPASLAILARSFQTLGKQYEEQGEAGEARQCYRYAAQLDPARTEDLIRCLEQGLGGPADPAEAERLREEQAARGGIRQRLETAEKYHARGDGGRRAEWLRMSLSAPDGAEHPALLHGARLALALAEEPDDQDRIPEEQEERDELLLLLEQGSAEAALVLAGLTESPEERSHILERGAEGWPREQALRCRETLEETRTRQEEPPRQAAPDSQPPRKTGGSGSRWKEEYRQTRSLLAKRRREERRELNRAWLRYRGEERAGVLRLLVMLILGGALAVTILTGKLRISDYADPGSYSGSAREAGRELLLRSEMSVEKEQGDGIMRATLRIRPFEGELGEELELKGSLRIQDGRPGFSVMTREGLRQIYTLDLNPDQVLRLEAASDGQGNTPLWRYPSLELYLQGSQELREFNGSMGEAGDGSSLTLLTPLSVQGLELVDPRSPNRIRLNGDLSCESGLFATEDKGQVSYALEGRYTRLRLVSGTLEGFPDASVRIGVVGDDRILMDEWIPGRSGAYLLDLTGVQVLTLTLECPTGGAALVELTVR